MSQLGLLLSHKEVVVRKRALVVMTVTATLAIAGLWAGRRAEAIIIINSKPQVDTGMLGLAAGQTVRVHVVNITDPAVPASPCNVEVRFFDAQGELLGESQHSLTTGRAGFVDHSDDTLRGGERKHLRATVLQHPPDPFQPLPLCVTTAEVFDNRTGRAGIIVIDGHPVQ